MTTVRYEPFMYIHTAFDKASGKYAGMVFSPLAITSLCSLQQTADNADNTHWVSCICCNFGLLEFE